MADLSGVQLDPNVKEVGGNFDFIPAGHYQAKIVGDDVIPTKAGNGLRLELYLEILDTEYSGCMIRDSLNIENPSQDAREIGQGTLKRICKLTGVPFQNPMRDTRGIWNKPLTIKVKEGSFQGTYGVQKTCEVSSYSKPRTMARPQQTPQTRTPQQGYGQGQGGGQGYQQGHGQLQRPPQRQEQPPQEWQEPPKGYQSGGDTYPEPYQQGQPRQHGD